MDTGFFASDTANADSLLTYMNMGRELTLDDITINEVDAILAGWKTKPATGRDTDTLAGDRIMAQALTAENVRISTQCKTILICFMPRKLTVDVKEFHRQLKLQEKGLNRLTPYQYQFNRAAYLSNPAKMRKLSKPLQEETRKKYKLKKYPNSPSSTSRPGLRNCSATWRPAPRCTILTWSRAGIIFLLQTP